MSQRKTNPASGIYGARRYDRAAVGFDSKSAFQRLYKDMGASAASTYWSQRALHGATVAQAITIARNQVRALGKAYAGGMECTVFRTKAAQEELQRDGANSSCLPSGSQLAC